MRCGPADVCQLLLAFALLTAVGLYVVGYLEARRFFGRRARLKGQADAAQLPRVTLLKPLKGADAELYRNLFTFCDQDYPIFQIVFGVVDGADPAVQVVQRLQAEFPSVDIALAIDSRVYGTNLKVSNLHNMYRSAKYEIILIADSDIRVSRDYLRRIVAEFEDPRVGLATCLYRAVPVGGLPAVVEALCVNTDFVPMVMVARVFEQPSYAFGSTIAIRRAVLDTSGGFLPLVNYLADDYHLGNRIVACGQRLVLSSLVVETVMSTKTWREVLAHQVRWARTQRVCRPAGYFGSVVTHGTLWASVNMVFNHFRPGAVMVAALVCGLRMLTARTICTRYLGAGLGGGQTLLLPLKDLFTSVVWLLAFLGSTVQWGGRRLRVRKDGQILETSLLVTGETETQPQP